MGYKITDEIYSLVEDTISIIYPSLCAACDELLVKGEDVICTNCAILLPRTNFHQIAGNVIEKQFWGKVQIEGATAYYHFHKGEKVQTLMHRFKYENRPDIGVRIGQLCATELKNFHPYNDVELILPIPLHKRKLRTRGYNQAAAFAEGLSSSFEIPFFPNAIGRTKFTSTQTKKSRIERYTNVKSVFKIKNPQKLMNKHILLVDDVVTTGSTLATCVEELKQIEGVKVSLLAIAFAEK